MRTTNFQTDDPALTKLLEARGFTVNRSMNGITFHPSQFGEVDAIVREFDAQRTHRRNVGAIRRSHPTRSGAVIRSAEQLLSALTSD
jgi:hypothetical protein